MVDPMADRSQGRSLASRVASWLVLVLGILTLLVLPLVTSMPSSWWSREAEQLCGMACDQTCAALAKGSWDGKGALTLPPEKLEGLRSYLYPVVLPIGGADSTRMRVYAICTTDTGDAGFVYIDFDLQSNGSSIERVWPNPKLLRD